MKRRTFLKNTAAIGAGAALAPNILLGNNPFKTVKNEQIQGLDDDRILIIVELFGGNDGLNTIVPVYNDTYYNLRPKINITDEYAVRYQTSDLYFNPNLINDVRNTGFMGLLDEGRLAIVEGIGYANPNLSHFRSRDIWHSGVNDSNSSNVLSEGWLGKYFASLLPNYPEVIPEDPLVIQVGGSLDLLVKTMKGHMGIALKDPDAFYELGNGVAPEEEMMPGTGIFDNEFNFTHVIARQSELYAQKVKTAFDAGKDMLKTEFSEGFAEQFRMVASLIAGGLDTKVYYLRLSNFDSHAQQQDNELEGQHPTLLRELANGVCEFMDEMVEQGLEDRVLGMTISEFGRRAKENGSRGTDHGAASVQFVFGKNANAGYYGEKPNLDVLDAGGNINYQYDYRMVYADVLETWFGADPSLTENIFGDTYVPLGVIQKPDSVPYELEYNNNDWIKIYPNPSISGDQSVEFELKSAAEVNISIYDKLGYKIATVCNSPLIPGVHNFNYSLPQSGSYIISLEINGRRVVKNISILK